MRGPVRAEGWAEAERPKPSEIERARESTGEFSDNLLACKG